MYFFVFILLLLILFPNLEKVNNIFIYIKLLVVSSLYFYFISIINTSIIVLLITLLSFMIISVLIYRLIKTTVEMEREDATLFNLAHEVKNPIAVCKGYLDMLDINDRDKIERYVPIIKSEMDRALTIMNNFLDLKRITLTKDLMDVSLLIEDVIKTMEFVLRNNDVNLSIQGLNDELIIDGDYDKLKQVLVNLIKNSYEADAKNIRLDIKVNKNYLKLKIFDDGIGIAESDISKIGDIFYTTKVGGTGVGVSLSKEIIKLHNGDISYDSTLGKGTTVTIILPIRYIF